MENNRQFNRTMKYDWRHHGSEYEGHIRALVRATKLCLGEDMADEEGFFSFSDCRYQLQIYRLYKWTDQLTPLKEV